MDRIVIDDNEGVELISKDGRWKLYVSLVEQSQHERVSHAFQILADRPIEIAPHSNNSVVLKMQPASEVVAAREVKRSGS